MATIDGAKYSSYMEMCKAFYFDYQEFMNYKKQNTEISELELLGHFIRPMEYRMIDGTYRNKHYKM